MPNECNIPSRTIFIGDNLDILRGINSDSVDLIYLDPPFNSKRTYAAPLDSKAKGAEFKDVWTMDDMKEEWVKEIAFRMPALHHAINAAKLTHSESMAGYLTFMSIRLMEMRRVLKRTGSIYLHCDPSANAYLRVVMDDIFGARQFRNEIVWRRASGTPKGSQHKPKKFGQDTDTIFHYAVSRKSVFHGAFTMPDEDELVKRFPYEDGGGRYNTATPLFCQPSLGARPNLCYEYNGVRNPHPSGWRVSRERLAEMDAAGLIIWRDGKRPLRKTYASSYKGRPIGSMWADIPPVGGSSKERTDWRTQKPLALLERIIKASSNPGDLVLDPFCGCATACIAAESLGRNWIGIDKVPQAADVLTDRARRELQIPFDGEDGKGWEDWTPFIPDEPPSRTDLTLLHPVDLDEEKDALYESQGRKCAGCEYELPLHVLTVDHITPRSKGGLDAVGNIQLLCHWCNATKGNRSMEYLRTQLRQKEMLS